MDIQVEIKPCPFCGNTKVKVESKHHGKHYYEGTHSASVRCSKCHARGPTSSCKVIKGKYVTDAETNQKAIELWNAIPRTSDSQPVNTSCEGCINIGFRYPLALMYPCNACVRANPKDYYMVPVEV